eukprot:c25201_g1_i1 orf=383-1450(-)
MQLSLESQPFDLAFHPSSSIVAIGLISGHLQLFRCGDVSEPQSLWTVSAHLESCRAVRFAEEGQYILTASPDCSILATNVETGQAVARLTDAHGAAINRLINLTETTIASGDDDGIIKVWDTRQNTCCNSYSAHVDYVADMEFVSSTMQLLAASGDGTLSLSNLRSGKVDARSEFSEDELLSVVLMKHGQKVICGSQTGILLLYSWGYFNDCSDRFAGHPQSVEAMLKLDEDTIITGSSDGLIRVVSVVPNRIISVIGEHSNFPIERLAFSHDCKLLGSASHDHTIQIWDMTLVKKDGISSTEGNTSKASKAMKDHSSEDDSRKQTRDQGLRRTKQIRSTSVLPRHNSNFFNDLL